MVEIHCVVTGKVQGVRYRDYVQRAAAELGLFGWIKNCADGSVEVCAQGIPDDLKLFVEYLHEGSLQAKVDAVATDWRSVRTPYHDFSILY
jgi:acylphosphatase